MGEVGVLCLAALEGQLCVGVAAVAVGHDEGVGEHRRDVSHPYFSSAELHD